VTVANNTIGGITGGSSGPVFFTGIGGVTTLSSLVVENNTVGGTAADSIHNTSPDPGSQIVGISSSVPSTISGNTIRNLTAAGGTGAGLGASIQGISVPFVASVYTIERNTIHSLRNSAVSGATHVDGLLYGATAGPSLIARNFIHSFDAASPDAVLDGIHATASGATTFQNNMIRLGIDAGGGSLTAGPAIGGIFAFPSASVADYRFYFNSVYVGGSGIGGSASTYAFNSQNTLGTRDIRNNIFYNARSNGAGTGKHYAVRVGGTAPNPAGLTIDYNIYRASGAGSVFGFYNGADRANLAAWQAAVGQDAASIDGDPQYQNPTGTAATVDLHIAPASMTPVEGNGVAIASVVDDFDGQTRALLTPVDIGADAADLIPLAVTLASFAAVQQGDAVLVSWETVSELDNAGFNLYRGTSAAGPETLLAHVPSAAPGSAQGFAYSHLDENVQAGQTYWYWLEDISLAGATTLHGPVSVTLGAPTAVRLAEMVATPATPAVLPAAGGLALLAALAALAAVRRRQRQ
jgi:hypothetical protein